MYKRQSLSEGNGEDLAYSHMMNSLNYDHYIGYSSQRIAIYVSYLINKIILLISVLNVKSKLSLGKNPPEDIIERE